MKRMWIVALIAVVIATVPLTALAQVSGPPANDAWVELANPDSPSNDSSTELNNLWARSALAACNPDRVSYLKWNLTGVTPGTVFQTVAFTVQANFVSGDWSNARLSLREATDGWGDTVTWNTQPNEPPTTGSELGIVPVTAAGLLTFSSDTFPDLKTYVQQEADGDNTVSFALVVVGNCGIGSASVRFDSSESSGVDPRLDLTSDPNAVTMTQASAERVSWPLYAGLGAVALFVVAGLMITRRRTA